MPTLETPSEYEPAQLEPTFEKSHYPVQSE